MDRDVLQVVLPMAIALSVAACSEQGTRYYHPISRNEYPAPDPAMGEKLSDNEIESAAHTENRTTRKSIPGAPRHARETVYCITDVPVTKLPGPGVPTTASVAATAFAAIAAATAACGGCGGTR